MLPALAAFIVRPLNHRRFLVSESNAKNKLLLVLFGTENRVSDSRDESYRIR